jgi:hypothetical protein
MEVHDVDNVRVLSARILKTKAYHANRIPTYAINAAYMGPLALYLYFTYGRATKPDHQGKHSKSDDGHHSAHNSSEKDSEAQKSPNQATPHDHMHHDMGTQSSQQHDDAMNDHGHHMDHQQSPMHNSMLHGQSMEHMSAQHMHMMDPNRPFWATVFIGVSHCGAGCVLGDLVGEWLVYGTNVMINGQNIWPALLIDYGFALLFGIVFQYFSIGPMSGQYGPKTLIRATKADILSLTSFELGLFGWMVAYQVGIWNYRLETNTWTYWWMMQVGMIFGFFTSAPVNWWLLKNGIKEPCA